MTDLSRKSSDELRRIFLQRLPPNDRAESDWLNERDHALGEYWRRRLADSTQVLSAKEVAEVLVYAELDTALGVIGDAARLNMLEAAQCAEIIQNSELDQYPKAEWAKAEVRLRIMVNRLVAETEPAGRSIILHDLLHQKRFWPLAAVLGDLTDQEITQCERQLADREVLTKSRRAQARQAIRGLQRKVQ